MLLVASAGGRDKDQDAVDLVAEWLRPVFEDGKMVIVQDSESTRTRPQVRGCLLYDEPVGGIEQLSLPGREVRHAKAKTSTGQRAITTLVGPDRQGRIVYIQDHPVHSGNYTSYRIRDLDGTIDEEITSCAQGYMDIPRFFGMSRNSGQVAFVAATPGGNSAVSVEPLVGRIARFDEGEIVGLDLDSMTSSGLGITALAAGIALSPDGKWLAYVGRLRRQELPDKWQHKPEPPPPKRARERAADGFAVVRVMNLQSKEDKPVGIGSLPVLSFDGRTLYFMGPHWDLQVAEAPEWVARRAVMPPGMTQPLLATSSGVVLGFGQPDSTGPIRYTTNNSPLVGKKQMVTLRVGRVNTTECWTLIKFIDPRRDVSGWIEDAEPPEMASR